MPESAPRTGLLAAALVALGVTLAAGLAGGAYILGHQARQALGKQSITVKGLAEKPVTADQGSFSFTLNGSGATIADALANLRSQQPAVRDFIRVQGYSGPQIETGNETFEPVFRKDAEGRQLDEISHYRAHQPYRLTSRNVRQIATTEKALLNLQAGGLQLEAQPAQYLVSGLESIKMSLIGAATRNARARAEEFAKTGDTRVGSMVSAQQGAFYILPAQGESDAADDYGGAYDKSTIEKKARVVVTIVYTIGD
ncbi:SIMPL domain-containing protein [Gulbenkiania mobilis]|uniref:SIMPL domain-containing protein n=1 Tax=Gulbenkiania mobilis TaxID=397457 RepID=A0ABY2D1W7_GULMO|nr:SIMPL domain-containing protein [Gulbenkiania mobilis]TCW32741.1 hypothetical protein EV669_10238 [Gulbenkiania mobilis]